MDAPTLSPASLAALPPEVVEFIRWLIAENARLTARVAELEEQVARLTKNSSNSSKPPSTEHPHAKARAARRK